ncbi:MAG: 1-acyl-sn-glycerol-3-phosphate acyltransferase [Ruminococcaceae bacterium]|nr:1-acyl-sn-glycerol-3-phosphate acyltransferase [Oscillospiraceae bacterium]
METKPTKDTKAKKTQKNKKDAALQRARRRNRRTTNFFRPLGRLFVLPILKVKKADVPDVDGGYLLLCNHNTNLDFVILSCNIKRTIYYVLSEHVMQQGLASKLLSYFLSPIARTKGTTASATAMAVLRVLKRGDTACIFAEGNRSFNGLTCPILPATGKLARASGAPLVTYKLTGGYFTSPRWSYSMRKGAMTGEVVHIYSPEELRAMTDDEVNEAIRRDLFEDAYARQEQEHIPYRGKKLAEGMEHALFMCPECGAIGKMHSHGSHLSCECGMRVKYDVYGMLSGTKFSTITEWDRWQHEQLCGIIDKGGDGELFFDDDAILYTIDADHNKSVTLSGRLAMSRTELTIGDRVFPISEMSGLAIYGRRTMVFEHGGTHYEISSKQKLCSVKYVYAFEHIRGK